MVCKHENQEGVLCRNAEQEAEGILEQAVMTGVGATKMRTNKKIIAWHTKGGGNGKCKEGDSVNVFRQFFFVIIVKYLSQKESRSCVF